MIAAHSPPPHGRLRTLYFLLKIAFKQCCTRKDLGKTKNLHIRKIRLSVNTLIELVKFAVA